MFSIGTFIQGQEMPLDFVKNIFQTQYFRCHILCESRSSVALLQEDKDWIVFRRQFSL